MKERDFSIDILKCLAAILITWSHMEPAFGQYSWLCTGGSFGDALFFFCSGYTLFIGRNSNGFLNWYKRRVQRIYPTVLTWALLMALFLGSTSNMATVICGNRYFFIPCIMMFYIFLYPIRKYFSEHLSKCFIGIVVLLTASYFCIDHSDFYADYRWKFSMFFLVMLSGAIIGKYRQLIAERLKTVKWYIPVFLLVVSIVAYYALMYAEIRSLVPGYASVLNIYTLLGFCLALYFMAALTSPRLTGAKSRYTILAIGSLCLDIYFVQYPIFDLFPMTGIFPLNVPVLFVLVFICAYILHCLSNVWTQTFKEGDYNWKEIFRLVK